MAEVVDDGNSGTGSAKGDEVEVEAVIFVVGALTGSGVELTRVKWLLWEGGGGPVVVGEWLRDRVRETVCRPGDVLPLPVPLPVPGAVAGPLPVWWPSRDRMWFCV